MGGVGIDGRGREVLPEGWEGSEVPSECRESLTEFQESLLECWVSLPKCCEESGGLPAEPGGDGRPSQMVGRGREAHSDGRGFGSPPKRAGRRRESLLVTREGMGRPEGVRSPSWPSWRGSRPLPIGRPPGGPGWVGRSSRRAGMDREALLEGLEGSGGPPGGPGGVGRSF